HEGFRTAAENDPRIHFNPVAIDTVPLARHVMPELTRHRLNDVAAALHIPLENHHRALDDAICAGAIFANLYRRLAEPALKTLNRQLGQMDGALITRRKTPVHHIILLVRNYVGLYHLYRLVSESHIQFFNHRPRIPKSLLTYWRSGLILGSACEAGEIFRRVKKIYHQANSDYETAKSLLQQPAHKQLARYYDYLEIQPLTNNAYLLRVPDNGIESEEDLIDLNKLVVDLAALVKKPAVATCDSHFLEKEHGIYRDIMQTNMGFADAANQPDLYFRTTQEMIDCFAKDLGREIAYDLVVRNPRTIAASIQDDMRPFPDGSFPPLIESAAAEVETLTWETAHALYGREGALPDIVTRRIERELKAIIDNGFAVMYFIAHKLVKKSNEDGYIVGSRGSVGSSLVASLCGITEVNPLVPHYRCIECRYTEFIETGEYGSGYDLPAKNCPDCGAELFRDGQDIPFETFLGFDGDKQPDIDLNFSGEYQPEAHRYVVEMFGATHTYRAGTIGSYAEKNAEGLVRGYLEKHQLQANRARIRQLASGLNGVKRTTGQHPGGIVVIPKEREVYDFTPVQFPANDFKAPMTTTHFDFNSMHDTILKLDILGHMDPTMLKMLSDITGQNVTEIPIPDEKVMSLFVSNAALGLEPGQTSTDAATLGLPELGTPLARDMIKETKPSRFYNLVQLMGLSHGTDVWKGNAQDLIRNGTCTIDEVIGCRDGIMTSLIHWGIPSKTAFDIMEKVRKGRGLTPEQETLMREKMIPEWYIDSCKKIKYMFPKAHAAAYSISSLRIAWFKVYHPEAFYAAYFTVRAARQFDASIMCQPKTQIIQEMNRLKRLFHTDESTEKDKKTFELLELVEEMYARGIDFLPVDIMRSEASHFKVEGRGKVRPALDAIPGISPAMAEKIVKTREEGPFKSQEEVGQRCGLGTVALQALCDSGCLGDMPATNQIDLFS
ncbi:MAG TPA: PolC-type DNA polymerase III, partial [Clostridiaceae bacterium]|nr:PolC-type DNA polymerase III [Clostridiaceae bacterium]